ncbi:MAG: cytochrome c [Actinomycetota bacterium]|nr:cytochrome c [Actinomycetota bacterium]
MSRIVMIVLLTVSACSVSRPGEDDTGEEIYSQLCANCHAEDLSGGPLGPAIGPGSDSVALPDAFFEFAIVNGRGSMPSFSQVLDEEQVDRLVEYIREVQEG